MARHRRKQRVERAHDAAAAASVRRQSPPPPPHGRRHFRVWFPLALLIFFSLFESWFDHRPWGHWLHLQTHHWLHSLVQPADCNSLPVTLVDISELTPKSFDVSLRDSTNNMKMDFTP